MVITMTQKGDAVTAGVTAWLGYEVPLANADKIDYSLTGTVTGDTFSLQATESSNPLTFTGTCTDANTITGTMTGEMTAGDPTDTAQITCVRLNTSYPHSITGQWEGVFQMASLNLIQTSDSVQGVGWVQPLFASWPFDITALGSVSGQGFTLTLSTMNSAAAGPFQLSGIVVDHTLIGVLDAGGLLILKRKV